MASAKREVAMMEKRRELMWELHEKVAKSLLERLSDPDATVRGSTFAVAIQFLKDNGIVVTNKKADLSQHLSDMIEGKDLPFQ
jgi:hypothetical protein